MDHGRRTLMEFRRPLMPRRLRATRLIRMRMGTPILTSTPTRGLMCTAIRTTTAAIDKPKPPSLDVDPVSASQRWKWGRAVIWAWASNHRVGQGDLYLISPAERAKV